MANNRVIGMFYELKDAKTGDILESNFNQKEIYFVSGKDQIIKKLEDAVLELKSGESAVVNVSATEGVGEYDESAVQTLPKEQFAGIDLVEGMELFGEGDDGNTVRVIVKAIGEEEVMIDFNHPYAGKDLVFDVKIVENREANADEILSGAPDVPHACGCGSHEHHGGGCCGGRHHDDECCDDEDDECCGGEHHKDGGGCCGRHHH